jgi:hypothetical protein
MVVPLVLPQVLLPVLPVLLLLPRLPHKHN